jgi:hypothetical protein
MHMQMKHPVAEKKQFNKKIFFYLFFILIVGGVLGIIYMTVSSVNECKTADVLDLSIEGHTNLNLHIHPQLSIIIDGKNEIIPANIGVTGDFMRPVHTHDETGELHVEGPCMRDFTLGDFFTVWGKRFDNQCIFDHCTDAGKLTMMVDGVSSEDFENLILKDGQTIVIEYVSQ